MKRIVSYCQNNAVFAIYYTDQLYITKKMERFGFLKVGVVCG